MTSPQDILTFWFDESGSKQWFNGGPQFDAEIRERFQTFAIGVAASFKVGTPHDWQSDPDSALALIIVLDQFPRNMFRDTKAAFAWDAQALSVAQNMVDKGWDLKIPQDRRSFVYMPFMHSENLAMQNKCVALVDSRLDSASTLHHAKEHRRVIERFGRFPHRNSILARPNTPEEQAFLDQGGYTP